MMCSTAYGAELLVKARANSASTEVGDVIAVRPDGWGWGNQERLPYYIVIKMPGVSVEEAQKYETPLMNDKNEIVKFRKYTITLDVVSTAKTELKSDVSIASKNIETFKSSIIERKIDAEVIK